MASRYNKSSASSASADDNFGLVSEMFRWMWEKQDDEGGGLRGVLLPDTVVFRGGKPSAWYFTSFKHSKEGEILRKNRENMTSSKIVKAFCKPLSRHDVVGLDVVAVLLQRAEIPDRGHGSANDEDYNWRTISELGTRKSIVVEYLNKPQLVHFFRNRNKQEGSVLQRE